MARSPQKLKDLLYQRDISESTIDSRLTIVVGNVITDVKAVQQTLLVDGSPVDLIISGIGGKMRFNNPLKPTLDHPTICQDAVRTILAAARQLERKPTLVVLSTTGISDKKRDLPVAMMPLYHWLLKVPHDDKKAMETLIFQDMTLPDTQRAIENYIIVRPSLLTDGDDGIDKVRAGTEDKPAVGYVISRNDVGNWLFENLVRPHSHQNPYLGQVVTITT